ncbi:MAG TPA: DUF1674 domain-containing protein [Steroidobacteraceae bacterium]|jgi:hypothetical protein|nr:DUF1674 domain-containing protein [Steroidobacteraceae bacterium]
MPAPITPAPAAAEAAARAPQPVPPAAGEQHTVLPRSAPGGAEIGGPGGPEPTRYGDWERRGRCIDF